MRQDSIMEQIFEQIDRKLHNTYKTRSRNLKIRTYKVVPLSDRRGIIEWVLNTITLYEYLLQAHPRYRPQDLKPSACRKAIEQAQGKTRAERIKTFESVCAKFKPVFSWFFVETYRNPSVWYSNRLAYTRSVASSSMIGYILGLGDRHSQNLLIDKTTGQIVHIDLGLSFEQGKVLPIPETVPFRLTRDMVDAMGITGTEGVFRRCCELTLEVLRSQSPDILSILDVLKYDPLYSWTMSPVKLQKIQGSDPSTFPNSAERGKSTDLTSDTHLSEAERAILIVERKLSENLSVESAVSELIQEATSVNNLALLYCGWSAFY